MHHLILIRQYQMIVEKKNCHEEGPRVKVFKLLENAGVRCWQDWICSSHKINKKFFFQYSTPKLSPSEPLKILFNYHFLT